MKTDYCVIETGLGGRLDSTNVLNPLAVVITSISLEHTNVLGDTIEQIAYEKAAIIKNGSNVFIGMLKNEAEKVVEQKCNESKSKLFRLEDFIDNDGEKIKLILNNGNSLDINSPLKGIYQKNNAALAALTVSKTFLFNDERKYLSGIENILNNTGLQGRYEYYHKNPTIIFDSAHNPEGIENFLSEFAREAGSYRKKTVLFGAMRDKAIKDMLLMLSKYFDEIIITEIQYERAAKAEEISELCKQFNIPIKQVIEPANFVKSFTSRDADECLVVLGSMYLLGEIKQQLLVGVA